MSDEVREYQATIRRIRSESERFRKRGARLRQAGGHAMSGRFIIPCIVAFICVCIAVGVGAQRFCIHVYAPWMLDSNDVQAIAFMCSSTCSK